MLRGAPTPAYRQAGAALPLFFLRARLCVRFRERFYYSEKFERMERTNNMGPLSHTLVSTKVTGRKNSLLILGSLLPDIAWSSTIKEWRYKLHENSKVFYDYIKENYPQLLELAIGVRLHSYEDRGADYYSDDEKVGFAKIEAHKISNDVTKLLGLESNGLTVPFKYGLRVNSSSWIGKMLGINKKIAFVIAHNFIEGGVDLNLLEKNKDLVAIYKRTFDNLDLNEIVASLSQYLGVKEETLEEEIEKYIKLIKPNNFSSINTIATETVLPLLENRLERKLDSEEVVKVLKKAKEITQQNYLIFLNKAINQMQQDFKEII